jgi:hypothetical protein
MLERRTALAHDVHRRRLFDSSSVGVVAVAAAVARVHELLHRLAEATR